MEERVYTIPLGDVYEKPRKKRAPRAIKEIKKFVKRHLKVDEKGVKISNGVNSIIWNRGIEKPPRKIKVKVVKEEYYAYVLLPEEPLEAVKPKPKEVEEEKETKEEKEESKVEKEKEEKVEKKEEKKESEEQKEKELVKKEKKESNKEKKEEKE